MILFSQEVRRKGQEGWGGEAGAHSHDQRPSNRQKGNGLGPQSDWRRPWGPQSQERLEMRELLPCPALKCAGCGTDLRKDFQVMRAQGQ